MHQELWRIQVFATTALLLVLGAGRALCAATAQEMSASPGRSAQSQGAGLSPAERQDTRDEHVAAMEGRIEALEAKLQELKDGILLGVDKRFFWVYGVGVLLVLLGVGSVVQLRRWATKRTRNLLDHAIYKMDPTYVSVKVPAGFEAGKRRLEWLGFRNLTEYPVLSARDCAEGCVVVKTDTEEDLNVFRTFLQEEEPDAGQVAYVLFTSRRVSTDILDRFENITFSNSLATLGTAVYTVARGLLAARDQGK